MLSALFDSFINFSSNIATENIAFELSDNCFPCARCGDQTSATCMSA